MKTFLKSRIFRIVKRIVLLYLIYKAIFFVLYRVEKRNVIKEKSGISVPLLFWVIESEVIHNPTAFDSDYTWRYTLKVGENGMRSISDQVEKSTFFDPPQGSDLSNSIEDSLQVNKLKGYWKRTENGYEFFPSREEWAESTIIEIDTNNQTIEVELTHL